MFKDIIFTRIFKTAYINGQFSSVGLGAERHVKKNCLKNQKGTDTFICIHILHETYNTCKNIYNNYSQVSICVLYFSRHFQLDFRCETQYKINMVTDCVQLKWLLNQL